MCKATGVYSLSPIARRGMGYSWDIHGVFICVGYVSVMYRLCVGYVSEEKSSEGVTKKQVKNGVNHGLARMGTETRDMIPPTPTARDLNYLNQKWEYLSTKKTINILALASRKPNYLNQKWEYLSTKKTINILALARRKPNYYLNQNGICFGGFVPYPL